MKLMVLSSSSAFDAPPLPANALSAKPREHVVTSRRAQTVDSFFTAILKDYQRCLAVDYFKQLYEHIQSIANLDIALVFLLR